MITKIITYITSLVLSLAPMTKYTEGIVGQPSSFLPHQAKTQHEKTVSNLIFRGLFKYDIYGNLTSDLAEKWEISDDGLVYTITLKDNQHWSDGSEITSDDVIYTAFKIPTLSDVGTDRVDDRTVRFILPNKFSPFLSILTRGVMKQSAEEKQNKLKPITSGDFRVISVQKSGPLYKKVTLLSKSRSWSIRKLEFKYYANEEELVVGARLGEIEGFLYDSNVDLKGFKNYKFPVQSVYYGLIFNLREDKLDDLEFREKLRETLPINQLIANYGIGVEGPISRSKYTKESVEKSYFNKDFTEEIWDRKITVTVPDIKNHVELVKRVENFWEDKLNLSVEIKKVDSKNFIKDIIEPRNFEVLFYGQQVGRDPDRYVYWHSTQDKAPDLNISGFSHVRADRALEEGRNALEFNKRTTHYNEFQDVILKQIPAIFMYHPFKNYYVTDHIDGIGKKDTFTVADRFLDFYNWRYNQGI